MAASNCVLIVGAGTIGIGWAVAFYRAGWTIKIYDQDKVVAENAVRKAFRIAEGYPGNGEIAKTDTLEVIGEDVQLVIECVPESIEVKQTALAQIEENCSSSAIIASSTSALPPSIISAEMRHPARFIVAHPFNPCYLIPLVEIVPCKETSETTIKSIVNIMSEIGQKPVRLSSEISGFIANRLQAAVVNEAMSLVAGGVANPEEVDAVVSDCLGLRWAFYGPFETMALNAQDGFAGYAEKFGASYTELGKSLNTAASWDPAAIEMIDLWLKGKMLGSSNEGQQKLRDILLERLLALKAEFKMTHQVSPYAAE